MNVQQIDEDLLPLNFYNSQLLICALNFREKDFWLSTLYNNKESYKDYYINNSKN
jgi:predicted RNA-binding protein associated with RNAse of E/G family